LNCCAKPWFRAIAEKIDPYYLAQQGVTSAYNHSSVVDENLIMRYYHLNMRAGTRKATIDRFQQYQPTQNVDLSRISVPTLIMWGEDDVLTPFSNAARFEAAIPDTRTAYYQGVGHVPMEEIPDQSSSDLIQFLRELNQ
jgi:pimeloyl-ACP methyl ester carboxylesterase